MTDSLICAREVALGDTEVSQIGLGLARWDFQPVSELSRLVGTVADAGVNLIDSADVYGGEAGAGRAEELLGEIFDASPSLRQRFVVATKAGAVRGLPYDSSTRHILRACDASLSRLHCDSVDLFQIHRPDFFAHPHDVAEALTTLKQQGKIRMAGVSNYTPSQLDALLAYLPDGVVSTSPQISVTHLDAVRDGTLDQAMKLDVTVLAWGPLAKGRLISGEQVRPALIDALDAIAEREGVTRTAVAMAFVLALPGKTVALLGTTKSDRFLAAARGTSVHLDRRDVYVLIQASEGATLP